MSPRRNNKLKLAAYAGALVFSALVWFGVVVLGRAMLADRDDEAVAISTIRSLPAGSANGRVPDAPQSPARMP